MRSAAAPLPCAASDLTKITEVIADYASPNHVKQKLSEITAAAQGLIDLPHRDTRRDHILPCSAHRSLDRNSERRLHR